MSTTRKTKLITGSACLAFAGMLTFLPTGASAAEVLIDDFDGGVTHVNHPEGSGVSGVWYDAAYNTFGAAASGTLDGSLSVKVTDGGFTNGVYAIYEGVIPVDGEYELDVEMKIIEDPANANGIRAYQVGVSTGGDAVHRGSGSTALPGQSIAGTYSQTLDATDNSSNATEVITVTFTAQAGDDLLIALSTDVESGGWNLNSGLWGSSNVLVDNITLRYDDTPPPTAGIVVDDFESGVAHVNHPGTSGDYGVWYDAKYNTFGNAAGSNLDGSMSLKVTDGGFTNGVYAIYENAIPAAGDYIVDIDMKIIEDPANSNGIRAYQLGVASGADAQHRGDGSTAVGPLTIIGTYQQTLDSSDNSGNATETVSTTVFTADGAGDLLVALGTDVASGGWNLNSGVWGSSHVLIDNIVLRPLGPQDVVLDDFEGGVVHENHPGTSGQYNIWYDAKYNTFGSAASGTLDGSLAVQVTDGGFTNGVYAIYPGAVPQSGKWQVLVDMKIIEDPANSNGIRAYQVGVATGADAQHRGDGSTALSGTTYAGTYSGVLDSSDNSGNPKEIVATMEFDASAGDDVLIALGTDVQSGGWNLNSGTWGSSYVLVDNIILRPVDLAVTELIADNDDGSPVYETSGAWSTSGGTGYDGGTYQFAFDGNAATATWNVDIPTADLWEVSVIYRAGTNRTTSTRYEVQTAAGTEVVYIDQTVNDLSWVSLGTFSFDAGPASVTLDAAGSTGGDVVIADAVRFQIPEGPLPPDDPEMRVAVITVFDNISSAGSIDSLVNQIAGLNYNAIAVHARYRGDATYYPNKTDSTFPNNEPRSTAVGSVDVIEEFTTRGHAAGLKVYAYVNTNLVTDGANTDPRANHVVNTHPEWITYAYNGGSPIQQTTATDGEGIWIDAAIPAARYYTADICGDIMMNYDCDGIILDRIRYPQTTFTRTNKDHGYNPQAIAQFNAAFGKTGVPDPYDSDWIQFRRDQITLTVQEIYNTITTIDPQHELLAYPIGRFSDAINFNYQEWPKWMDVGVIDGVLPQIYSSSNGTFSASVDQHLAAYGGPRLLGVTLNAFTSGIDLDGQIALTRAKGADGVSPFRHGSMGALGYFADLQNVFVSNAPWPDMPWKTAGPDITAPAAPANLALVLEDDSVVTIDWDDNAEADLAGYNVYRSTVSGGPYSKISALQAPSGYVDTDVVNGTRYYYVVTASDWSGNESVASNEATGLPELPPTVIASALANGESTTSGTVAGSYSDTHASDDVYEALTEVETDGNKFNVRVSKLEHTWTFNVSAGRYYRLLVEAHHTANSEGDDFILSYSKDGVSFVPMLVIEKTADDNFVQEYTFPEDVSGTLYVKVVDADRTGGNTVLDTLYVDAMQVDTYIGRFFDFSAPFTPQNLVSAEGDGIVALAWDESPEADLDGYSVYRAETAGGPYAQIATGLTSADYADTSVVNGTQYFYVVTATDAYGNESDNSAEVLAVPYDPAQSQVISVIAIKAMKTVVPYLAGYKYGSADVQVVDNLGNVIDGVTVTGVFSGDFSGESSALTNASGEATIVSADAAKGGLHFTLCVTDLDHPTLTYNPNLNQTVCDSF